MSDRKFLDSTGLSTFLTNLKNAYTNNNTDAFSTFTVGQAGKLANARTVTFATGDVTGSFTFDGSANVSNVVLSVADAVASASGEGGSHGLMTAAQAEKLAGVASGAQVNVLEGVQIKNNGDAAFSDLSITNKKVQIDLSGYAKLTDIAAALNFRDAVTGATLRGKTASNTANGDVYTCTEDDLTGDFKFHAGYEYAAVVSGTPATLTWVELGKYLDLSGYALKTQKVNGHALSGDITLDGSDIALTGYTKASTSAAVAATDTVNAAVGKLEKKVDDNASAISSLQSGARSYAFAEGSTTGAFQVTETIGSTTGAAQSIAIHGLGSAAYTDADAYVSSTLTPAEAGAQVNIIETVKVNGTALTPTSKAVDISVPVLDVKVKAHGTTAFTTVVDSNKDAKIDLSGLATLSDLSTTISSTGYYVTGVSYDNATGVFSIAKEAKGAVADSDAKLVDGNAVYDYIDGMAITDATINALFGIS